MKDGDKKKKSKKSKKDDDKTGDIDKQLSKLLKSIEKSTEGEEKLPDLYGGHILKTLKELKGLSPETFDPLNYHKALDNDVSGLLDKLYNPADAHLEQNLNDSINTVSVLKLAKNIRKLVKEGCTDDKKKDKDDEEPKKKKGKKKKDGKKKKAKADDEEKKDEKKDDAKDEKKDDAKDEKKDDKKDDAKDEKKDEKKEDKKDEKKDEKAALAVIDKLQRATHKVEEAINHNYSK